MELSTALASLKDADFAKIRTTVSPPGKAPGVWVSVFDFLENVAKKKNPHEVLRRLENQTPEVLTFCESFKFPGRGQHDTPICTLACAVKLLQVTPGEAGREARSQSAELLCRYYGGDLSLVGEVFGNAVEQERLAVEEPMNPMGMFGVDVAARGGLTDAAMPGVMEAMAELTATLQALPAAIANSLGGTRGANEFFDRCMQSLTSEDKEHLFRDISDTKLADAPSRDQRVLVLHQRRKALFFVYREKVVVARDTRAHEGEELWLELVESAKVEYNMRRQAKAVRDAEAASAKIVKAAAAAAARAKAQAEKSDKAAARIQAKAAAAIAAGRIPKVKQTICK